MKSLLKKPYFYFWVTAAFILVPELIFQAKIGGSALDINVHDTYFVIDSLLISLVLFVFYVSLGVFYFAFQHLKIELKPILTVTHTIITVGVVLVYNLFMIYNSTLPENAFLFGDDINPGDSAIILSLIALVAQILFIFNLIISSISAFKKRHES